MRFRERAKLDASFQRSGERYQRSTTRFFSGQTSTGCGGATSAVGPFDCPVDQSVYIDLWAHHAVQTGYIEELTQTDIADGLSAAPPSATTASRNASRAA